MVDEWLVKNVVRTASDGTDRSRSQHHSKDGVVISIGIGKVSQRLAG